MAFPWKNPPSEIQLRAIKRAWKQRNFALFHAMGAGKTFTTINLAAARFLTTKSEQQISLLVIICPSPIKDVWRVELEKHCPCDFSFHAYASGGDTALRRWWSGATEDALNVLTVGVEALSQGKAFDRAMEIIKDAHKRWPYRGVMIAADESSRIKTHKATRSKKAHKLAHECDFRLILTGTPITQGFQDLFSQFWFLDPHIIGMKSFVLFRNMYCIQGGFENRQIIGYQNIPSLMEKIAPYCDIVTKEEAMPYLKPKNYASPIIVQPTPEQKRVMKELKEEMLALMEDKELTVSTVMDRLTRYQQVCGGFFPYDDEDTGKYNIEPIKGGNPKLTALLDLAESIYEAGEKVIIWARFRPELELIAKQLRAKFGQNSVAEFHGGIHERDRPGQTHVFETSAECRFMVANPTVGGMGQTWIAASYTIYYSNTFSYEDRMQSEDRNHRRGQQNIVTYYDIVMDVPADRMILKALAKKGDVADEFKNGVKNINFW